MEQKKIDRINQLAKLSRERELTEGEKAEQAALREEYVSVMRKSLERQLDSTYIKEPDGTVHRLPKK